MDLIENVEIRLRPLLYVQTVLTLFQIDVCQYNKTGKQNQTKFLLSSYVPLYDFNECILSILLYYAFERARWDDVN